MGAFLFTVGLGLLVCVLGVLNMMGNISTIHRYHRAKVSEENRKPFGRLVGLGTLIIGVALMIYGTLLLIADKAGVDLLVIFGNAILILGIVAGAAISFYAMKKYNGSIF